jgi:peptidoglycan/xylan/chitin deacetylase (PgdA/CDA1 family)
MRAILTYHSIDDSGSPISLPPAILRAQLTWLARRGVRVVTVDELLALPASTPAIALTFDDGFASVATYAAPLLAELGLPATVFVVSGHVGGTNAWGGRREPGIPEAPLLDWPALRLLVAQGVAVGAHTRGHPRLTDLPADAVVEELESCAERIREELGRRPHGFAYPYGATSPTVRAAAARTFMWACTTELREITDPVDRAAVPRVDMYYFRAPGALESWGTPAFARRLQVRRGLRRVSGWWRTLRGQAA